MKKFTIISLLSLLLCMVSTKSHAYDIAIKNNDGVTIYYNLINNNTEAIVTYQSVIDVENKSAYIGTVNIPESITNSGNTISVTRIDNNAFAWCDQLISVSIPNSVTSIGDYAFRHCNGLTSVNIGDGVETIGEYAFEICGSLASVHIGRNVTAIGSNAFAYCSALTSITIPSSVTHIEDYAFRYCGLKSVMALGDTPATISSFTFYGLTAATLYVPFGTKTKYETANGWKQFAYIIEFDAQAASINQPQTVCAEGAVYSISGLRVKEPQKGIYIQNGKKIVIH